jgi:hypothetical protein
MNDAKITQELMDEVLHLLMAQSCFRKETISFEVQDDAQFLLASIAIDDLPENEPSSTFKRVGHLLNQLMPSRKGDYSWMVNFTRAGRVVDSYFGGDLDCPDSGL